jgi:hypothetical protein
MRTVSLTRLGSGLVKFWTYFHPSQILGNNPGRRRLLSNIMTVGNFFGPMSLQALLEATRQRSL